MVQLLKRITKHRIGKRPCQTAVIHLNTSAACNILERKNPEVAALLNTIDLERKREPEAPELGDEDFLNFEEQDGSIRDELDEDGVLLLGNGRAAGAQEVSVDCYNALRAITLNNK
jgi:hypothetical protein